MPWSDAPTLFAERVASFYVQATDDGKKPKQSSIVCATAPINPLEDKT
jgi:hypothetical protein